MNKNEYLEQIIKQISYVFDIPAIKKELSHHIDDLKEDLQNDGYSKEEAEKLAIEMMGDPIETGKQLNKVHNPFLGYMLMCARIVTICIICAFLTITIPQLKDTVRSLSPIVSKNSVEVYEVNKEFIFPTHKLIIDNICVGDNDSYTLTYRCFRRYDYTRSPFSLSPMLIMDETGHHQLIYLHDIYSTLLGFYGEITLKNSEDKFVILINNIKEESIPIDIKEYQHD